MRPSWDDIWMDLAESLSRRSTCERLRVGCVIVSHDNTRVLGVGYNGGAAGVFNGCLSDEPGKCGHLHAEINALIKVDYTAGPSRVYVTTQPCFSCAVALVNARVSEVVYKTPYRLKDGLDLLFKAEVVVRQHNPEEGRVTVPLQPWPTIEPEGSPDYGPRRKEDV